MLSETMNDNRQRRDKEDHMHKGDSSGAAAAAIWFIGWLFTISFAHLVWWKIVLGVVVWPLFLGQELG